MPVLRPHRAVAELELGGRPLHQVGRVLDQLGLELPRGQRDGARADRAEAARVGARGDGPEAREGVHLVDDGHVLGREPQLVGDDLRDDGLMPLALRGRGEDGGDAPERIDLDRRGVHGARLRQVLGLGAELRIERRRHVAHVRDRRIDGQRHADAEVATRGAGLPPARAAAPRSSPPRAPSRARRGSRRCRRGRRWATRYGNCSGLEQVPPPHLDGIEPEPLGQAGPSCRSVSK